MKEEEETKALKECLIDMVYQFGYRSVYEGKPAIHAGGLSALEDAFAVLGWENPHILEEEGFTCEIKGCMNEISSGQSWDGLYLSLCHVHSAGLRAGNKRPEVKDYAIEREKHRDKTTGILQSK